MKRILGLALVGALCVAMPIQAQSPKAMALLVGCTTYTEHPTFKDLPLEGPGNDVPLFERLLCERFGFDPKNITRLVGWPDEPEKRPTYGNIKAAFEALIQKVGKDTQVVILLAGHGTEIPIPKNQDPLDPKRFRPDGQERVFVAADAKPGGKRDLENVVGSDDLGAWIDQMRDKGAAVWIILDCCHSGGIRRGKGEKTEVMRGVDAEAIGIPKAKIDAARRRAEAAVAKAIQVDKSKRTRGDFFFPGALNRAPTKTGSGSVVAFYASLPFERTPELRRPTSDAANWYGLFSYTLTQVLEQRGNAMSYRELNRALVGRYRAENWSSPTPFCEGDLDRDVLGLNRWPSRSIVLRKTGKSLKVNAGELAGLTIGSVLAVNPPAGDRRDPKAILGHVKVVTTTAVEAVVQPCPGDDGKRAVGLDDLSDLARCVIVSRDLGEMRVKLAIGSGMADPSDPDREEKARRTRHLAAALELFSKEGKDLFVQTPKDRADWILGIVTPAEAKNLGLGGVSRPVALLARGDAFDTMTRDTIPKGLRTVVRYSTDDPKALAAQLERDVQRIFTWQSVWHIAGMGGNKWGDKKDSHGLKLEIVKLKGANEIPDGELLNGSPIVPGQRILIRLTNEGNEDLWLNLVALDANFRIEVSRLEVLKAGAKSLNIRGTIDGKSPGSEGIVVLANPVPASQEQPNFAFLDQGPLGIGSRDTTRGDRAARGPQTPFGQLMMRAALGRGARSFREDAVTNPVILTWTWVTLPTDLSGN